MCSICRNNYTDDTIVRRIKHCNHYFCASCLDTWFETNCKCPHCRTSLLNNDTNNENNNDDNDNNSDNDENEDLEFENYSSELELPV